MPPDRPVGRWSRWYASVVRDKVHYPDRLFRAYAETIAHAAETDGAFKSREQLAALLRGEDLVDELVRRKDLRVRRGGRVEVVGWDVYQWRGGAATSTERVRRHREKLADPTPSEGTGETQMKRTRNIDSPRLEVISGSGETRFTSVSRAFPSVSASALRTPLPTTETTPPDVARDPWAEPESDAITWLARHQATLLPSGNGLHRSLIGLVERHGSERTIEAMEAARRAGAATARTIIFGATNLLDRVPAMTDERKAADVAERTVEQRKVHERAVADTRRRAAELRRLAGDEDDSPDVPIRARVGDVRSAANRGSA